MVGDFMTEEPEGGPSYIERTEPPEVEQRKALLKSWCDKLTNAKQRHAKAFKRMDQCAALADGYQWTESYEEYDDPYIANLIQRHVHQRTSTLYAKNPTVVARRKRRRVYKLYNGDPNSVMMAQQMLMMAQTPEASAMAMTNPMAMQQIMQAQALIADYQQGQQYEQQVEAIGETLAILSEYFQDEQYPRFKQQMKQAVRRFLINGVAYAKIGFQRETGNRVDPATEAQLADARNRLQRLQQLAADFTDGEFEQQDGQFEELTQMIQQLESRRETVVLREGIVWSFPRTQSVIVDPQCRELIDFVGANWVAEEYLLTCEQVEQIYGIDLSAQPGGYTKYGSDGNKMTPMQGADFEPSHVQAEKLGMVCVWEIWDKQSGLVFTVADGYGDYLRDPKVPPLELEHFYPFFAMAPNQLESKKELYPQSDVWLLRHAQREYNRTREALRQHRWANRPLYVTGPGAFDDEDIDNLASALAHDVITLKTLGPNERVNDKIQPMQKHGIDPNMYETASLFDDIQRVVGTQEANLGGVANSTATEAGIAESSRMSSLESQIDELDDILTAMKRAEGRVLLKNMNSETVFEIVGPGAVWPELTADEIVKEVILEIEAGSSGRPNQAADIQAFTQMTPIMIQIPGIKPEKLADMGFKIMNSRIRTEDFLDDALPSITAMNQLAGGGGGMPQPATGDPSTDPSQQGAEGQNNAPQPDQGGDQAVPGSPGQPPQPVVR